MMSSSTIVWWHFSDLHWAIGESNERRTYIELLFSHLRERIQSLGTPNFIVISGDISATGDYKELEEARQSFINELRNVCSDNTLPVLVVPGNHDLSRKQARFLNPGLITAINSVADLNEFLDDDNARKSVCSPFADFSRLQHDLTSGSSETIGELSWARRLQVEGKSIYVVGINTAWACGYRNQQDEVTSDERRLLVGLQQFTSLPQRSQEDVLRILVMHHPLNWLKGFSEHQIKNHLQRNFDFVLFGHTHTLHDLSSQVTPNGQCIYLPSPALHTRIMNDSIEYTRGYNIVVYDTDSHSGRAYYFKYSDAFGPKFTRFSELFDEGQDSYSIELKMRATELPVQQDYRSYGDVTAANPSVREIQRVLQNAVGNLRFDRNSLDIYDQLSLEFFRTTRVIETAAEASLWEAFALCRSFLTCELVELRRSPRGFSMQKVRSLFQRLIRALQLDGHTPLSMDASLYERLGTLELDGSLSGNNWSQHIPEHYLRFYMCFWVFSQIAFHLNYPQILPLVLRNDTRMADLHFGEVRQDVNVIATRYEEINSQITLELRTRNKDEFLAVATSQHYLDRWIKEVAELWRQHHRILPPLSIKLEFPLWSGKDVSGNYFIVETRSIVGLLMGKAMYGTTAHIWIRELLQNALDANSTRQALEGANYEPRITIHFDGKNTCTIRDNGIGMSYQHIIRYLTTLGRSIWSSDELDDKDTANKKQRTPTIGRFGIGFVSVFQDAERVYVRTRFFRDIGEDGWEIDFQSTDKPFFVERQVYDVGTEVQVILAKPLSIQAFTSAMKEFFLYITGNIEIIPDAEIAKDLESVPLITARQLSRALYVDKTSEHSIGKTLFRLRALFCYQYDKENDKDQLPAQRMQISNAGVKVFDQNVLFLKPGKRYVWATEGEEKRTNLYHRAKEETEPITQYWILIDFNKGYSPILPSRMEIDIEPDFSAEVRSIILTQFCEGLREIVSGEAARGKPMKARRKKILGCLTESIVTAQRSWSEKRYNAPSKFSDEEVIQNQAVDLYSAYCPIRLQHIDGSERFAFLNELDSERGGVYVVDNVAKSGLFKIFVRALGIVEWITVDNEREYLLLKHNLDSRTWRGIYLDRDIYADGRQLFAEKVGSALGRHIRGDYALVDSDIFGTNAYTVLPSGLPGYWKRAEAAKYTRAQVRDECPARVLLNAHHKLFQALDQYAAELQSGSEQELQLKLALDSFADGVIEQDSVTVARERWGQLRQDLSRITKVSLMDITYKSLTG